MPKLLLIEDDDITAEEIASDLRWRGFGVEVAVDGIEGLEVARGGAWDVIVIDRMLPGCDGLTVLKTLRGEDNKVPALILSAMGHVDERVRGLRAGGDDYLTKPFSLVELAARVEALLRRPAASRETLLRVGPLELDLITSKATRGQRSLDLLPREFKLLEYMVRREGQVVTPAMLFEEVWNYNFVPQSNLIHVHMGRLRRKLDASGETPLIETVRGIGYTLHAPT
ncbi:response regulator transcription factor [Lichenifustis flavocetrariae]|uniref:Response regulator transcription factor n=1 Tax=Lichenifustis flavocetrariae TaxID=2949735 RepID=A0AA41Z2C2_9HYPH|nr:response regulator transcription factor [Lichenifustis flavocetrariae]MCW6512936.1 response regulator transcription factor [Lichenifustis flavocetrariae]